MAKPPLKIEGSGNCLFFTNAAGGEFEVLGLKTVGRPTVTVNAIDVTDQKSGGVAEFIGGKATPTQQSFTLYYSPGSDLDVALTEHLNSREVRPYKIVEKTGRDGETQEVVGELLMLSYVPDDAEDDNARMATVTVQTSGLPTVAVGT